nr:GNAT family N-acetyltransferase [Granulicella arctica]
MTTDRLGFSQWNEADLALAMTLWGDPRVSSLIGGPFTPDEVGERLSREIEMMSAYKVQYWPVFSLQTHELVGCAGLRPYRSDEQIFEMGVHLRPDYWSQGFAQEAARAVIDFAFETLGVQGLFAGHHPENVASGRFLPRLGFRFTHEEFYPPTGLHHPSYRLMNPRALLVPRS